MKLAKAQQINHVIIEANFGDGMFTKLISPYFTKDYPCLIEEVKHSKQKEARIIDTLEPVMSQHKLIVDRNVIVWDYESTKNLPPEKALKYQLFYQMSRITRDRGALAHDDRLDCLAMAVGYWVEQMGQDVDRRMDQRKEDMLKEELKAWENEGRLSIAKNRIALQKPTLSLTKDSAEMLFSFQSFTLGGKLAKASSGHSTQNKNRLRKVY